MCLSIPGKIVSVDDGAQGDLRMGRVAFGGITKEICLAYVPDAELGDYVIVHVGFAISKLDQEEARQVFSYLAELGDLEELGELADLTGPVKLPEPAGLDGPGKLPEQAELDLAREV